jgi:hypothetical protein
MAGHPRIMPVRCSIYGELKLILNVRRRRISDLILVEGSISPAMAKSCTHQSLNLVGKGIDAIHSGGISGFNQQVSGLQGRKGNISRRHPDRNNDDLGLNANQNSEDLEDSVNGNDTGDDGEIDSDKDNSDCDIPGEEAHLYSLTVLSLSRVFE